MLNFTKLIVMSLGLIICINKVYSDSAPIFVPISNSECSDDFAKTCQLQCPNNKYVVDEKGCPTCTCTCPEIKCRANCGKGGYQLDANGCQTCKCAIKESVRCSLVMCRMFCMNGFKRDENGCEYCACNDAPQKCPELNCQNSCSNGFQKDYSGCQTCQCVCPPVACPPSLNNCTRGTKFDADGCPICSCDEQEPSPQQPPVDDNCPPVSCVLDCKYGLQRDESGCPICACNSCPIGTCRMYCMYGFRRNEDGCEVCECDWSPVADKIQCSERIPCPGTRVCNMNLGLCETVDPDKVNWFLYDFEVKSELFRDAEFVKVFKDGLIRNIAAKYDLEITQITVSSVEDNGLTSFQIMPFFVQDLDDFEKKMDQIDIDLNSHEFRAVLPAVAKAIDGTSKPYPAKFKPNRWCYLFKKFARSHPILALLVAVLLAVLGVAIIAMVYIHTCRRHLKKTHRTESKVPIYDTPYHQAPTDEGNYRDVKEADGSHYIHIGGEDPQSSNEKRILV